MKTCSMTERKILEPGGSETGRGIGIGGTGIGTGGRTVIVKATDIDVETELRKGFKVHMWLARAGPKGNASHRVIAWRFRLCLG
jgi:hypothetical protein